jgi:hypothetical protein
MLTLTQKPDLLSKYGTLGFDLHLSLGEVGILHIDLQLPEDRKKPDFSLVEMFQALLGEKVRCEYGRWFFAGRIDQILYGSSEGMLSIIVKDSLSTLASMCGSQVFADQDLGEVIGEVLSKDIQMELASGLTGRRIGLAIQYQESSLTFLKRLAGHFGGQIWCDGEKVHFGWPNESRPRELGLGQDVLDLAVSSALGSECVRATAIAYRSASISSREFSLPEKTYGKIQDAATGRRRKNQPSTAFHLFLEDPASDEPEFLANRLLRGSASGRLWVAGTVIEPISPGTPVRIEDVDGESETLVATSLVGGWRLSGPTRFRFEAVSPDAVAASGGHLVTGLHLSPARVEQTSDALNRVRVSFGWDEKRRTTPWLRMATPYWGEAHVHYAPPKAGDTVLVMWGRDDLDPIVLGSIASGYKTDEASQVFALKTDEGHVISIGKENIRIFNGGNGGKSGIEILPGKVLISSDRIEMKSGTTEIKTDSMDVL